MTIIDFLFIFFTGSFCGWVLDTIYNLFASSKKLINPGFLAGPYVPIYGFGLLFIYLISLPQLHIAYRIILFFVSTTVLEYLTGVFFLKVFKLRLWNYSNNKFNIGGYICPRFSIYWTILSMVFYYFIVPLLLILINTFSSFFYYQLIMGFVLGLFVADCIVSFDLANRMQKIITEWSESERLRLNIKLKDLSTELKSVNYRIFKGSFFNRIRSYFPFIDSNRIDLKSSVDKYFKLKEKFRKK